MFDTYENKVWLNGAIVRDGILQRNCTSIVPLDRNNNIYTNTNGNADVVFFDKDDKYISTLNFYNNKPVLKENFPEVTIGNGKIRIGLPGINKDIVLDANDIETFKQSLVK